MLLAALIQRFMPKVCRESAEVKLRPEEEAVIMSFAAGASNQRKQAVFIYREHKAKRGVSKNPYLNFMQQVDRGEQDAYLREFYRLQLVTTVGKKSLTCKEINIDHE